MAEHSICVRDSNGKPGDGECAGPVPDLEWIARPPGGHAQILLYNVTY
ncbi:MAG: hypothetical protein JWR61_245 [Ferruginibacter sp.]|nr:hypothetical protein [Ferruginibacter sp.]